MAMIADLHAHYPMHVMMGEPRTTLDRMLQLRGRPLPDKARALVLRLASRLLSDRDWWSGARVTVPSMREGGVRLALSVLYSPFEEMDLDRPYGAPPESAYFRELVAQLERVEQELAGWDDSLVRVVRDRATLDEAIRDGAIAIVHCVEGGFHLGETADEIHANAAELARRGVAYVTLAHLFWRQVATNAPALPFLPDRLYDLVFPQPRGEGLTALGRAAVEALARRRILIDVSHMRADALEETLDLLDELDPKLPVIASHAGYRFGKQSYMLDRPTVERIAARQGVIGLIMAQHQLNDGIRRRRTKDLKDSLEVIWRHIDRIGEITGSHRHVALGSDLDGFIKPTMGGIDTMADLLPLEPALSERYGKDAGLISSGNALRVLRQLWGG